MNRFYLKLLVLFSITLNACSQDKQPLILNDKAPAIKVSEWLEEAPELKGKVIVIDFWFVSCAPCIASIPHLNSLVEAFDQKDIVFLAVTDDSKKKVQEFQKQRKVTFKSHVGFDRASRLEKRFGVVAYPQSYIIDKEGLIRWSGSPLSLSAAVINEALGNEKVVLANELSVVENENEHLVLRESNERFWVSKTDMISTKWVRSIYIAAELQKLVAHVKKELDTLVEVPETENGKYDVTYEDLNYEGDMGKHSERMLSLVLSGLNYELTNFPATIDGYKMEVKASALARHEKSSRSSYLDDESLRGAFTLSQLALNLSKILAAKVQFQGNSETKYYFSLDLTEHEKLLSQLDGKYGIKLVSDQIEVKKWVINPLFRN